MHETHEVRIHGRGGQGAVLACSILAQALIDEGKHAVAIPSFGFERRGAPVAAFLRFDTRADPGDDERLPSRLRRLHRSHRSAHGRYFRRHEAGRHRGADHEGKTGRAQVSGYRCARRPVRCGRHRAVDLSQAGDQCGHARRLRAHERAADARRRSRKRCSKWISATPA